MLIFGEISVVNETKVSVGNTSWPLAGVSSRNYKNHFPNFLKILLCLKRFCNVFVNFARVGSDCCGF